MTALTTPATPPAGDALPGNVRADSFTRELWTILLVLCGTVFLEGLDVSMMGVALPSIRADLEMSTSSLQWVVSAYVLGYGGFVLVGGRAADLLGRRRVFLAALAVFIAFSGLGGLAPDGWVLILARFATGVAAGFLTPASLSIITTNFAEGERRNRALLVYGGAGAAGFSLGMVVGGLLSAIDWRWVFFAPVLFAALLFAGAVRRLPLDRAVAVPLATAVGGRRVDAIGALTLTAGMLLLVMGVVRAADVAGVVTATTLAVSVALLASFVAVERRSASPLVRLGIFRSASLVRADLGAMLFVGSFVGFQFIAVLYLQELREWSALETGLALMVAGIDAVIAPTLTPVLVRRYGNLRVLFAGALIAVAAYLAFLPVQDDWAYPMMLPSLILIGLAFSFAFGPLTIAATDGIDESEQGLASALFNASVQFGAALVLAVVTAVNVVTTGDDPTPDAMLDGYRTALIVPIVGVTLAALITTTGLRRARPRRGSDPIGEEPEGSEALVA